MDFLQIPSDRIVRVFGIFSLAAVLVVFLRWNNRRVRAKEMGSKAPAVRYWLPFGADLFATAVNRLSTHDFFGWTRELLDRPGRTVALSMMGAEVLLTDDTENLRAILSTKFADFGKGKEFHSIWRDLMFDSIFATDGALWHSNKDLLRDHTAKARSTDHEVTERHASNLIRNLSDNKPHDLLDQLDRFVFDTVSDVFFGESVGSLVAKEQPIRDAVEEMYIWNTQRVLVGKFGALLPGTAKASAVVVRYLDGVIDRALSPEENEKSNDEKERQNNSLMGALLAQGVSRKRVKDSMMAILIGGKDPGSITIVWAFYELARNPDIVAKLRKEIEATVGFDKLPTAAQLKSMPLLQNIIKETLRLHVPLGFNIRTALRDTTLPVGGGPKGMEPVGVLEGTHVVMSYIGAQRRVDLMGPTADDFDPFRWEQWSPKLWEFLPFNHGPRICLGRNFAQMQMEYVICRLFQEFSRVEIIGSKGEQVLGGEEMKIKIALNTKPAEAIMMRFMK